MKPQAIFTVLSGFLTAVLTISSAANADTPERFSKLNVLMLDGTTREGFFDAGDIDYFGPAHLNAAFYGPRVLIEGRAYYIGDFGGPEAPGGTNTIKSVCKALGLSSEYADGDNRTLAQSQSVVAFDAFGAKLIRSNGPATVFNSIGCMSSNGGGDGSY